MNPILLSLEVRILVKLAEKSYPRSDLNATLQTNYPAFNKAINTLLSEKFIIEESGFKCPHCGEIIEEIKTKKYGRRVTITEKGLQLVKSLEASL